MKTRFPFLLVLVLFLWGSFSSCRKVVPIQSGLLTTIEIAPCVYRIPEMAYQVERRAKAVHGNNVIWVCPGGRLKENGGGSIIFLESGAELISRGGGNTVYAKSGAKIDSYGGGDVFYFEDGVSFGKIWGGGEAYISCANLTFDYSLVSGKGCN